MEAEISSCKPNELSFVLSSWKKSFRTAPKNAQLPSKVYYARANEEIDQLVDHSGILVARDPQRPDFIYGFIAYELGVDAICVHFVYIRHGFRRYGLAKRLLQAVVRDADYAGLDVDSSNLLYTHESRFNHVAERLDFQHCNAYRWARNYRKGAK